MSQSRQTPALLKVSDVAIAHMSRKPPKRSVDEQNIWNPYVPPRGVIPTHTSANSIAMDAGFDPASFVGAMPDVWSVMESGYYFPGFQILAQWSQIPEYRRPAEVHAREMTRKWLTLTSAKEGGSDEKLKMIEAEFKRLNVQDAFRQLVALDGLYGRGHIFLDFGIEQDMQGSIELKTELIDIPEKIGKNSLKRLTVIDPTWVYPNRYNANNPLDPTFYRPTTWFVMGTEVNSSRMLTYVSRPLPDILKPAYAFAGLSLSQLMKPYVDNWLRTRQSVSDLIHSFTVWVLKADLTQVLNNQGAESLYNRLQLFNLARDNHGVNVINKDTEEFDNVAANLGGLEGLQAQSQEHMCAPSGLPLVYLTGITPTGLNASSQDEIEIFQDTIHAQQEMLTPLVSRLLNIVMLSLFGEIDPDIGFKWEPLKVVTAKEAAEIRKMNTEVDVGLADAGILAPEEIRNHIANDPESAYFGISANCEAIQSGVCCNVS